MADRDKDAIRKLLKKADRLEDFDSELQAQAMKLYQHIDQEDSITEGLSKALQSESEAALSTALAPRPCRRPRSRVHAKASASCRLGCRQRGHGTGLTGYRCWHQALPSLESITRSPGCAATSFPTYIILSRCTRSCLASPRGCRPNSRLGYHHRGTLAPGTRQRRNGGAPD